MGKMAIAAVLVLFIGILLSGCVEEESLNTFQTDASKEWSSDNSTRIMTILSDKHYYNEKQPEIREKLEQEINSGAKNIQSVKTSYSKGYLTSGEITYNSSGTGDGNSLRVIFIHSGKNYYNEKQPEVKAKMDEIVNGGKYKIAKVQTIYASGYLVAAEIYYRI